MININKLFPLKIVFILLSLSLISSCTLIWDTLGYNDESFSINLTKTGYETHHTFKIYEDNPYTIFVVFPFKLLKSDTDYEQTQKMQKFNEITGDGSRIVGAELYANKGIPTKLKITIVNKNKIILDKIFTNYGIMGYISTSDKNFYYFDYIRPVTVIPLKAGETYDIKIIAMEGRKEFSNINTMVNIRFDRRN